MRLPRPRIKNCCIHVTHRCHKREGAFWKGRFHATLRANARASLFCDKAILRSYGIHKLRVYKG
jgi:REP element-mobilizing transposase RayT